MEARLCVVCKCISNLKCDGCGDFYCSEYCQQLDYPSHRYICFKMPQLQIKELDGKVSTFCVVCHGDASLKCSRCNEAYCSNKCQSMHWVNHRRSCFLKPCLVPLASSSMTSIQGECSGSSVLLNVPDNKSLVLIMKFSSTNHLYLKPKSKEMESELSRIMNIINDYGKNNQLERFTITHDVGLIQIQDFWYRFRIIGLDLDENIGKILIMDTGRVCWSRINEMYRLPSRFHKLKQYIIQVELKDIPNYSLVDNPVFKEIAQRFVGLYKIKLNKETKINNSCLTNVILFKDGEAKSLNQKLKERLPEKLEDISSRVLPRDMFDGKYIIVSHKSISEGYLACIPTEEYKWFMELQHKLKNLVCKSSPYQPKLNEMCLLKLEENLYRGKCTAILQDTFRIYVIDYGYEVDCRLESIREYPADWTSEVKTILISLEGLPVLQNVTHYVFLMDTFSNNPSIRLKDLSYWKSNLCKVKSDDLIAKMERACLINSPRIQRQKG